MQQATVDQLKIEWILMADSAEVLGGKLYMLGGGWDRMPASASKDSKDSRVFALAFSILVPWHQANEKHTMKIEIIDEDGKRTIFKVEGEFEVGRPAGAVRGQLLRVPIAVKYMGTIEQPGTYAVIGSLDGEESCRTQFHVQLPPGTHAGPSATPPAN